LDGLQFSKSTLDYALYFTKHTQAHLVGVFLDDFTYNSYSFADIADEGSACQRTHAAAVKGAVHQT
jgi:hypothetical protein